MGNCKGDVITKASTHTIKKFELIEKYITRWAENLMNYKECEVLVYIDCMCSSGIYRDKEGNAIEGSAIRVARVLLNVANRYPDKRVEIYFNDLNIAKIVELKKHLPKRTQNFEIIIDNKDAGDYLKEIGSQLYGRPHLHYFLLYDPYDADINWGALVPFFRNWGEVLINHMISDPVRAIRTVKKETTKEKYEQTYLTAFENLLPYGSNRHIYEERVRMIINQMNRERPCYVATFPFFNGNNAFQYDLIHYTSNPIGFKLFKKCAWQVFGGKSSAKHGKQSELQEMSFNFDGSTDAQLVLPVDAECFTISDIAEFLWRTFKGKKNVLLEDVWRVLDNHPIFPADGFRKQIKKKLTLYHNVKVEKISDKETLTFM